MQTARAANISAQRRRAAGSGRLGHPASATRNTTVTAKTGAPCVTGSCGERLPRAACGWLPGCRRPPLPRSPCGCGIAPDQLLAPGPRARSSRSVYLCHPPPEGGGLAWTQILDEAFDGVGLPGRITYHPGRHPPSCRYTLLSRYSAAFSLSAQTRRPAVPVAPGRLSRPFRDDLPLTSFNHWPIPENSDA